MNTVSSIIGVREAIQDDKFILYNTVNDKCIRIDKKSYEIYRTIIDSRNVTISELKNNEAFQGVKEQEIESFILFLTEKGFINGN